MEAGTAEVLSMTKTREVNPLDKSNPGLSSHIYWWGMSFLFAM